MIWVAMSPAGVSDWAYFKPSGLALNQDIYIAECLEVWLLPFIKQHHSNNNYLFWPDLASSHYAERNFDFMIENGINHVDKFDNHDN
mgnify:CR=1 FL=1